MITEEEQRRNAREELEKRKAEREEERRHRANSYGVLDRRIARDVAHNKWIRENCNCGAVSGEPLMRGSGLHAETCPVLREARSRRGL